jgi:hypothetical protein
VFPLLEGVCVVPAGLHLRDPKPADSVSCVSARFATD